MTIKFPESVGVYIGGFRWGEWPSGNASVSTKHPLNRGSLGSQFGCPNFDKSVLRLSCNHRTEKPAQSWGLHCSKRLNHAAPCQVPNMVLQLSLNKLDLNQPECVWAREICLNQEHCSTLWMNLICCSPLCAIYVQSRSIISPSHLL